MALFALVGGAQAAITLLTVTFPDLTCDTASALAASAAADAVIPAACAVTGTPGCAAGVVTYLIDSCAADSAFQTAADELRLAKAAGTPPTATITATGGTLAATTIPATAFYTARSNSQVNCVTQVTCAAWTGIPGTAITCVCQANRVVGFQYVTVSAPTGSLSAFAQYVATNLNSAFIAPNSKCVTAFPAGSTQSSATGTIVACSGIPTSAGVTVTPGNAQATIKSNDLNCASNIAAAQAEVLKDCTGCTIVSAQCGATVVARQGAVQTIVVTGTTVAIQQLIAAIRAGSVPGVPPNAQITVIALNPAGEPIPSPNPAPLNPLAYFIAKTTTQTTCPTEADCIVALEAAGLATSTHTITCTCTSTRVDGFVNVFLAPGTVDPQAFAQAVANALGVCVNVFRAGETVAVASACPEKQSKKGLLGLLGLLGLIPLLLCLLLLCLCCIRRRKRAADVHFATFDPQVANVAMPASVLPGAVPFGGPPGFGGPVLP